jgi:uncharacterized protein
VRVLVTGATGFIGRALILRLHRDGHDVTAWVRSLDRARALLGADVALADASEGAEGLVRAVESADAVVNLAGEPIMGGRLSRARRTRLRESRVRWTQRLVQAMAEAKTRPQVLISASAVGYYGDRGEAPLDEPSTPGRGFLAELCADWEQAALKAESLGVRVTRMRIGVVLGLGGGMLGQLLPMLRWGLGARPGSGRQLVPWIHLEDLVDLFATALRDARYRGAINAVASEPVRMDALLDGLARVVGARVRFSVPAFLLRLAMGEAADVILSSQNTRAARLAELGYAYKYPTLDTVVEDLSGLLSEPAIAPLVSSSTAPAVSSPYLKQRRVRFGLRACATLYAPLDRVFDFFSKPANLGLMTPAAMAFRIRSMPASTKQGDIIDYSLRVAGMPLRWRTVTEHWEENRLFVDAQARGPYHAWWHEHHFSPSQRDAQGTIMEDRVYYAPPFGFLGRIAQRLFVAAQLREIFAFRSQAVRLRFAKQAMSLDVTRT